MATATLAVAPASAQVTAKDLRAQAREITLLRTELRQQQDLVLLLRHRLAEAESAGAWLPWLLAAVAIGWGVAGWMALRWRKAGVRGHSLPAKGQQPGEAEDDSLTGPATVFAPGAMGFVQESSTAVHQISTAQLPLDINQLVPPAAEETRPAAVTLTPGTAAEQAFLSAASRRSAAAAERSAQPMAEAPLAAPPAAAPSARDALPKAGPDGPPQAAPAGPAFETVAGSTGSTSPEPGPESRPARPFAPAPAAANVLPTVSAVAPPESVRAARAASPRPSLAGAPIKLQRPLTAAFASAEADSGTGTGMHTDASARIVAIEPQPNAPRSAAGQAPAEPAEAAPGRPFRGMADLAARPPAADATQVLPGNRAVSVDELFDLEQQVDFFVALDQTESAIDLLVSHIRSTGGNTALPYLKLMEVYRLKADVASHERTRRRFNQRFNAAAPEYADQAPAGEGLERYAAVLDRLQSVWQQPLDALALLEALMYRRARGELFDLSAFHDILMLHAVAADLHERSAWRGARTDILLVLEGAPTSESTAAALAGAMLPPAAGGLPPSVPAVAALPPGAAVAGASSAPSAASAAIAASPPRIPVAPSGPAAPAASGATKSADALALPTLSPVTPRASMPAANDAPVEAPLVPAPSAAAVGAMAAGATDSAEAFRRSLRQELAGIAGQSPAAAAARSAGPSSAADRAAASPDPTPAVALGGFADARLMSDLEPLPPRAAAPSAMPASVADALSLDLDLSDFTPLYPAQSDDRTSASADGDESHAAKPWDGLQRPYRAQG